MVLEFRSRDYTAEHQAHSLPRTRADTHPLSASSSSPLKVEEKDDGKDDFFDPLRATNGDIEVSPEDMQHEDIHSVVAFSQDNTAQLMKEWTSFKKILLQRFPVSKTVPVPMVSGVFMKGRQAYEKSSRDLLLGEDLQKLDEQDVRVISQQECVSQLQELKEEIRQSWCAQDRVTSLRLSIKVARLLMDMSSIQFYPTLFVLATDIMDMLGDLVWDRIKQKAEFTEDGRYICSLTDIFEVDDICLDAKETCNNWFSKIGSVRELLPRIYLELAILPCWRFLRDHPEHTLQRLVLMTRGIADPVASAYCCLYMVHCAQKLKQHDKGYLVSCINDLQVILRRIIPTEGTMCGNLPVDGKLLLTMIEPAIEYIMRCLLKDVKQMEIGKMLVALGIGRDPSVLFQNCSCISIILHYMLKELPVGFICCNAVEILGLIEGTKDCSFDQCLNFKLLGLRLSESIPDVNRVNLVVDTIMKVLSCYDNLGDYLMIADAYLDIILENQDAILGVLLDGIFERLQEEKIGENELVKLQSIFLKIVSHFGNIEKIIMLNHFIDILDMTYGSSRNSISVHILTMATRNGLLRDPTVIEVLFEVAQALYDGVDFSNMRKDDYQHPGHVITRFVSMVDCGTDLQSHLRFLVQCRGAFAIISELQEMLVHACNRLAVTAMRDGNGNISFVKSCLAFNEVTIPSIPSNLRQLNLYLGTVEIALLGGFVSHSEGLIDAAVNCLQNVDSVQGLDMLEDANGIISSICKLCGMLVIVPGCPELGIAYVPKRILSFLDSTPRMSPRMKVKVFSAVVSLSAALAQNQLLYHTLSQEVFGNGKLFFGVQSYLQELLSLSAIVLQGIVDGVMQEPSPATRGKIALELCNCVASVFKVCDEALEVCSKLVEIARSCLSADDKFLQSTMMFLDERQFCLQGQHACFEEVINL